MARSFNGTSDKAVFSGTILDINTVPIGVFVHARVTSFSSARWLCGWSNSANGNRLSGLLVNTSGRIYCQHGDDASTFVSAVTTNTVTTNTWFTAAWADLSATSHTVWANGTGRTTSTTSIGTRTLNRWCAGAQELASPNFYLPGLLYGISLWDLTNWGANTAARLSAFEQAQSEMALGADPMTFPLGMAGFWRLDGFASPEIDTHPRSQNSGNYPLTLTGTSIGSTNPPVEGLFRGIA